MTTLYDLHIVIRRARKGAHPVRLRLERREPYPPHPARHGNELVLSDRAKTVGRAEGELPGKLLEAARLPAELVDLAVLGNRQRREQGSAGWLRESLVSPMARIAQALFQGAGATLVETVQNAIAGSSERYPWDRPDAVGRISVEVTDASLWAVPWELLLPAPAWQDEMGRSCLVVRRDPERAGMHTAPLTLPFTISIYLAAAELRDQHGWGDGLFAGGVGEYAQTARDLRALQWAESAGLPTVGAVHHIAFSSDDGGGEISAVALRDRDGRLVPIGGRQTPSGVERLAAELQQYAAGYEGRRPPRLLVLHNIAGHGSTGFRGGLDSELIRRGLETGADAVWVVHCGSSDPAHGDLFPMFYRKVLHNWALDEAVLAGLAQARGRGQEPLGWAFGARSGGELSVLLSEAVVAPTRSAGEAPEVAKGRSRVAGGKTRPIKKAGGPARGKKAATLRKGGPADGVSGGKLGGGRARDKRPEGASKGRRTEMARPQRGRPGGALPRSERAAAELQARVEDATGAEVDVLEAQAVRVSSVEYREEEHSLAVVLEAQERVQEAAGVAKAGLEARDKLAALPAATVEAGTVRLTHLSLSAGSDGQGPRIVPDEPLVTKQPYMLHVQIAPHLAEALVAEAFPDAALTRVFQHRSEVTLDVMVFSPASEFGIPQPRGTIDLPRYGPSSEFQTVVIPQNAGRRRLRVCLYYQNTMLQSLWMETTVVQPGEHVAAFFSATVDYVASADLALLDELPRPALNLFTNETPQGDHWLGVFGTGDLSGFGLRSGDMYVLSNLPAQSKKLRAKLSKIKDDYGYGIELDGQGHVNVESGTLAAYQNDLCELARLGRSQFWGMFIGGSASRDELEALGNQLQMPGLVSVARCPVDGATFPWAALYYLDIDTGEELGLCPLFEGQLAANRWNDGLSSLRKKADLLDDYQGCRNQSGCPLDGAARRVTVCPFGFWGFVHQIEQPLQQIKPVPSGTLPPELACSGWSQNSLLPGRTPIHLALGLFQDTELQTDAHVQELEGLQKGRKLKLAPQRAERTNRKGLIAMMEKGGQQVYYFYCHGVFEEEGEEDEDGSFRLKVGTPDRVGYIRPDNLSHVQWERDAPLVVLNGCETVAVLPERIHDFLLTLRKLGASGVVGTEIEVFPGLARPFGLQVLRALLDGSSLGEAFLAARLCLLRQYNPLGLAYSFYAPATLHLHDPANCAWCKAHPPTRSGSAPGA
jgi:hypothetical protein